MSAAIRIEALLRRYPGSYTYSTAKAEVLEVFRHIAIMDLWTGESDPPEDPADRQRQAKADLERDLFG